MPSLVRQQKTYYVDANDKRVPKGTPGSKKVREKQPLWYGQGIPGLPPKKRVPLAADKSAARRMLDDLVRKAERGEAGIVAPEAAHRPLAPLLEEYRVSLSRKSGTQHVTEVVKNAREMLEAADITTLAELRRPETSTAVEAAVWARTKGEDAVSPPTAAKSGKHARQFTRWLWRKKKLLDHDPLAGMDLPSQDTQNPRRPLTTDELARLLEVVENSKEDYRGLYGPDRATLYLVAVATGFRAGELAVLTPAHFDLDAEVPVARLGKKDTKNKKPAEQPLPPAVAARLRAYFVGKPSGGPVWPGTWSEQSAIMFKKDLDRAGIEHATDEGEALFHSLRHSYTTLLAAVAPVKVTQELSRHSTPVLTIGRYAHAGMSEKAEAVGKMAIPGAIGAGATGPFASIPRQELERIAEMLLLAVIATGQQASSDTPWDTPRDTPDSGLSGDASGRPETKRPRKASA